MQHCPICYEEKHLLKICQCTNGYLCHDCLSKINGNKCSFCRQVLGLIFGLKLGCNIGFIGNYTTGKTRHAKMLIQELNTFSIIVTNDPYEWYDIGSYIMCEEDFMLCSDIDYI